MMVQDSRSPKALAFGAKGYASASSATALDSSCQKTPKDTTITGLPKVSL